MLQPRQSEKPIRILLLEDDPRDAELYLRKLEVSGLKFTVKNVTSAEPFKHEIASNPYDLVLGDFHLPDWTGLDAVRWLRASGSNVPFILVTGTLGDELAVECIQEGASDYLLKDKLERLPFAIIRSVWESELHQQRDRTERELRESEKQFISIVEGSPYGIFRADGHGNILMANTAMVNMLGYGSLAEVVKLNMERDIYVNAEERHEILRRVDSGEHFPSETRWRRKDGSVVTVRLVGRQLDAQGNSPAVYEAFAQDVTEQRVLEQQFQQAQKMEAIGRLAGGVAHDFNNLLMIIRGCAELLNYHKSEPEKIGRYIKQIEDATSIAASVVQQLMAFSRKQVPERMQIDSNTVLRDLRKMLPRLLGEDIQIEFNLGQNLSRISADRSQIEQIILNLAVNARDAMPHGGKLLIATFDVDVQESTADKPDGAIRPGPYVLLSITDTGTGMPPDIQSHIFEPFFTTKERDKGTGLGLATVYGIVNDSGGHIQVESAVGKGTRFSIYFPAITTSGEPFPAKRTVPIVPGGSETILLVEDEEALREITGEYLRSRGYRILSAKNGLSALEILRAHDEPIDILLTDIIMPGIPGPELVKSALLMRPGLRVIYVSGYTDRGAEGFPSGHRAVILKKPYSLADLGRQIRSAVSAPVV